MNEKRINGELVDIELEESDLPDAAYTHRGRRASASSSRRLQRVQIEIAPEAVEILGAHGRLLSMRKRPYLDRHPEQAVYFNACVVARCSSGSATRT
jgi:hypothetical protein